MIEGLDKILEGGGQPGLVELRELLQELLGGRDGAGRLIGQDTLQPRVQRVFRLSFELNGERGFTGADQGINRLFGTAGKASPSYGGWGTRIGSSHRSRLPMAGD